MIFKRWRKARKERKKDKYADYNVVDGKVPWYTALVRFLGVKK